MRLNDHRNDDLPVRADWVFWIDDDRLDLTLRGGAFLALERTDPLFALQGFVPEVEALPRPRVPPLEALGVALPGASVRTDSREVFGVRAAGRLEVAFG
jgi:hypothetical protein